MCGLIGFFSPRAAVSTVGASAAAEAIRHRGPDDEGFVVQTAHGLVALKGKDTISELADLPCIESVRAGQMLLGHRRLSVIDLSEKGHQPLVLDGGRYVIAFNGEIYNYLELRDELQRLGHRFSSGGDTEVALRAWIQWGGDAFSKFNGMWAIAIWDQSTRRLILCRDRFGVKPLYISKQNGALYFASEMKALLSWAGLSFAPNQNSINKYLEKSLLNSGAETFWQEIEELKPGTWLELCGDGRVTVGEYWKIASREIDYKEGEAEEIFASLFEDSLRLRMRSDVEVGTLLSGGLDSNTIVGSLFKNELVQTKQFRSFSAVFSESEFSEEHYIDDVVKRYPLISHKIRPAPAELQEDFDALLSAIEEPFRSLSVYSQFKIYQHIRSQTGVKVVLNGQGADELFGGYSVHYYYLFAEFISRGKFINLVDEMIRFQAGRHVSFAQITIGLLAALKNTRLGRENLNAMLLDEVRYSPLCEYLRYDDRTSMSAGIEARAPFMDYRLVDFAFTLPSRYKIHQFRNKVIERNYASSFVSADIVNRRDKMGFVSPQEAWQRGVLKPWFDIGFDRMRQHDRFFSGAKAHSAYKDYQQGGKQGWEKIWRHFCLYQWLKRYGFE